MAKYSATSPYFATPQNEINLETFVPRTITAEDDDQSYTIERTYAYRPDLLAYDLYGTPRLWWVFAQRNPDQIEDPIDWRGIARAEDGARSGLRLLIAACVVGLCLVFNAFATSPPADADAGAPPRPAGPPLEEWLASFRFLPWRWERSAQWTGVGALVGLVAAFVVPLRSTPDLASSPPPEEYTVFS